MMIKVGSASCVRPIINLISLECGNKVSEPMEIRSGHNTFISTGRIERYLAPYTMELKLDKLSQSKRQLYRVVSGFSVIVLYHWRAT